MAAPSATDFRLRRAGPRSRLLWLEVLGLVATASYVVVADPHVVRVTMPRCPIKSVTGWDCPACGGLRVAHDLLHGRPGRALHDNLLLVVISPILGWLLYRHTRGLRTGEAEEVPPRLAGGLLVVAVAWMVLRNRPRWPWGPTSSWAQASLSGPPVQIAG